ncbi:MAG: sulfur carrier protein ThiS [Candidatus Cloacimonetes bacterium]|nr:sulfur carrier protein ThiS [Candidatus Cloacimonadota bacterium]
MDKPIFTVNDHKLPWQEGLVIRDALTMMNYTFMMLVIKINGVLVKKGDYDTAPIPLNAEVQVIHLISGG